VTCPAAGSFAVTFQNRPKSTENVSRKAAKSQRYRAARRRGPFAPLRLRVNPNEEAPHFGGAFHVAGDREAEAEPATPPPASLVPLPEQARGGQGSVVVAGQEGGGDTGSAPPSLSRCGRSPRSRRQKRR
jgi:hypothetical protein